MRENIKEVVLHVNLLNSTVKSELIDENGKAHVKFIDPDKLVSTLESHTYTAPMSTGLLPPNCVALTAHSNSWEVLLISDFDRCDVTYHETMYPDFPLPHMAVHCQVSATGVLSNFQLAVLDEGELALDMRLYVCPFPNVSGFSLCVGSNSFTGYDSLWKLHSLVYRLLKIPFADDSYNSAHSRLNLSARDLFTHLQDKTPAYYYSDVLIPSGKTLADFMKSGALL